MRRSGRHGCGSAVVEETEKEDEGVGARAQMVPHRVGLVAVCVWGGGPLVLRDQRCVSLVFIRR